MKENEGKVIALKRVQQFKKHKILVVVPGIGQPNFIKKIEILKNNLSYFNGIECDVCVFNYSENDKIPQYIVNEFDLNVVSEKGIVGDFLIRHITPEFAKKYTHVIISLDDAEIQEGFSIEDALNFYNENDLDILSLSYTHDSKTPWEIMLSHYNSVGRITTFAELMFYIMDSNRYTKYYEYIFFENPWMWGVDFLLHHMGFKLGIIDTMSIKHYFGGTGNYSNDLPDPFDGFNFLKEKFNIDIFNEPKILEYI